MKAITFLPFILGKCTSFNNIVRNWVIHKYIPLHKQNDEWWYNPVIHSFGNTGNLGKIHAKLAPYITKTIDKTAYSGRDVRYEISDLVSKRIEEKNETVLCLDFGCGVGISSTALDSSLKNNLNNSQVYGIDTSNEMLSNKQDNNSIIFVNSNVAKKPLRHLNGKVDAITVMFLLHECPRQAHYNILESAHELLKPDGIIAIADISETYVPSIGMLLGEPYVLDYQETFRHTLNDVLQSEKFMDVDGFFMKNWIDGHLQVTILRKNSKNK